MAKTKYNIEHQFVDIYRVVDPVDVASHQEYLTVDNISNTITIDLTKSNYFIADLGNPANDLDSSDVKLEIINPDHKQRFTVLFIEAIGARQIDWDYHQKVIYQDFNSLLAVSIESEFITNPDSFVISEAGKKRLLLSTFLTLKIGSDYCYKLVTTQYFESGIFSTILLISITLNDEPLSDVDIHIEDVVDNSLGEFTVSDPILGKAVILLIRNRVYNYTITYGAQVESGTITANNSELTLDYDFN